MRVLVVGANGHTGRRIVQLLRDGAHEPIAMVRDTTQVPHFEELGVATVVADLEEPLDPAMEAAGLSRYVMLSALRADPGSEGSPISHYLRAKGIADEHLRRSDLHYTIVRPGRLTSGEGTGKVELEPDPESGGSIPRDDMAAVMVATLDQRGPVRKTFDLVEGSTPIAEALSSL